MKNLTADTVITERLQDGTVNLTSADGHASILLAANQQHFTARYLAKVSQSAAARKSGWLIFIYINFGILSLDERVCRLSK